MYLNNHYPFSPLADLRLGSRLPPWCPWPCWALPGRWWKPYAPPRRFSRGLTREYLFFCVVKMCWVKNERCWSELWHTWCIHLCCTTRRVRVCPHFYQLFFLTWTCCSCCRLHQETEGNMDQLIYVRHVDKLASEPPKIKNLAWRYLFEGLWVPKGSCDATRVN